MKGFSFFLSCALILSTTISEDTKSEIKIVIDPKIINGNPASPGQFPWQAALFFQNEPGPDFLFCSGAIISKDWILTAAHCVSGAKTVLVYTGAINISLEFTPTATEHNFIIHEDFIPDTLANDVALVKLSQELKFDGKVRPIPLSSDEVKVGTNITVSGWGKTSGNDSSISPNLNYVNLVTISNEQCQEDYGTDGVILADMVCAGINPGLIQTPCHGDSGGPVVVNFDTNPRHVAIASFVSDRGCESGFPSGYTRTAFFRDWIKEKTGV